MCFKLPQPYKGKITRESDSSGKKVWAIPSGRQSAVEMLTKGKRLQKEQNSSRERMASPENNYSLLLFSSHVGYMTTNQPEEESVPK